MKGERVGGKSGGGGNLAGAKGREKQRFHLNSTSAV